MGFKLPAPQKFLQQCRAEMFKWCWFFLLALWFSLARAWSSQGPVEPARELEELAKKAQALAQRLTELSLEAGRLENSRASLENELTIAALRLAQAETQRQMAQRELASVYKKLGEFEKVVGNVKKDLCIRLGALASVRRSFPSFAFLLLWQDPQRWVRSLTLLLAVINYQKQELADLQQLMRQQTQAIAILSAKQEAVRALEAELEEKKRKLLATKKRVLADLQRLEAERREKAIALSEVREAQARLERLWGRVAEEKKELPVGVSLLRGGLPWPVEEGQLARGFGRQRDPRYGTVTLHPGWDLVVPSGAEVKVVAPGQVVLAQFLKAWGNVVIVAHGEGIYTLYGRLATMFVRGGQRVAMGESLGFAGTSDNSSNLYFEVRQGTRALDPALWLRSRPTR